LRKTVQTVLRAHQCNHDIGEQRLIARAIPHVGSFVPLAGTNAINRIARIPFTAGQP
jgi:hypothetical protein